MCDKGRQRACLGMSEIEREMVVGCALLIDCSSLRESQEGIFSERE